MPPPLSVFPITLLSTPRPPKLSFFHMNKVQEYFGTEAGDFNLYATTIPKCDFQRQSFTNDLQRQSFTNTVTQY